MRCVNIRCANTRNVLMFSKHPDKQSERQDKIVTLARNAHIYTLTKLKRHKNRKAYHQIKLV